MTHSEQPWDEYCYDRLRDWAEAQEIAPVELGRLLDALREGGRQKRIDDGRAQCPDLYVPGLMASPFHDTLGLPWVRAIEAAFQIFHEELDYLVRERGTVRQPESDKLVIAGVWRRFDLLRLGTVVPEALAICPRSTEVLESIAEISAYGAAQFTLASSGTRIRPHYGPHNGRLRCHLGLRVPEECGIRVGGETRSWQAGRCLLFDDSYEHEVWNDGPGNRAVLIIDVWHPDLTPTERAALGYLLFDMFWEFPEIMQLSRLPTFLGGEGR